MLAIVIGDSASKLTSMNPPSLREWSLYNRNSAIFDPCIMDGKEEMGYEKFSEVELVGIGW